MLRLLALFLTLTCACAVQGEPGSAETSDPSGDVGLENPTDVLSPWDIAPTGDSEESCLGPTPGLDSDGDGLLDVVEDRNLNCLVDAGETDPLDPDTDDDGLTDADEDVDRNGRADLERGETSPLLGDTDADGIVDGDEPLSQVCRASVIGEALRSRLTLGSGRVVATSPDWSSVPVSGPSDVAMVTGPEEQSAVWFAWPAGQGEAFLSQLLEDLHQAAEGGLPLLASTGDSSGVWAWEFEVDETESPTHWTVSLLQSVGFTATQAEASPDDVQPDETFDRQGMTALTVRVEYQPAQVTGADADRVLLAVVPDAALLDDWLLATGVSRIAPTEGASLEVVCESLLPVAAPAARFVVVADTRAESRSILESIARALGSIMGDSPAHLVPADMHELLENAGLAGPLPVTFATIPDVVADWVSQSDDQRLWLNALAALTVLNLPGDAQQVVLLLVSAYEDAEFHFGVTGGRDGDAGQPILPDGADRTALETYYGEVLSRVGVSLVTVSPAASFDAFGCAPREAVESVTAFSFQAVARGMGGVWVNGCADAVRGVLSRSFAGLAPTRAHYVVGPHVLASSALGGNALPLAWLPGEQTREQLAVSARAPVDVEQHVAYLRWALQPDE